MTTPLRWHGSHRPAPSPEHDTLGCEVELLEQQVGALEAKLAQLLSQKDVMRRHAGSQTIPRIRKFGLGLGLGLGLG